MRTSALLMLLVALPPAEAKQDCMSKAEARRAWPNNYIAYRIVDGRRCWFNPEQPPAKPTKVAEPPAPAWVVMPADDRSIWYPPQRMEEIWYPADWPVYSTFDGDIPDVWP